MPTSSQLARGSRKIPQRTTRVFRILVGAPNRRGVVYKIAIMTPRKPNSAKRKIVKVRICVSNRRIFAQIPGWGHNLHEHSVVMIEGGGAKDLPGVSLSLMRGLLDFTGPEVFDRQNKRSKYGVKREVED